MAKIREIPNSTNSEKTKEKSSSEKRERRPKQKEESNTMKHYIFLAMFLFPSLAWVLSVGGDVINNMSGLLGNIINGMLITLPIVFPIIIACYSKKLRGLMLKVVLPVSILVLLFPTVQVYLCSPIELKNEDLGTKFSLKTTADQFLEQSCIQECLNKSMIASPYRLSLSTPRAAIKVPFRQIVNLNLTTSAMVNGKQVKVAKLLLLASWRSVKGRYHALNLIARIPVKIKKLDQALEKKQDMILTGRVVKVSKDLQNLKGQLEKQKRFVRPMMLEVHKLMALEAVEKEKEEEKESKQKKEEPKKAKEETREEKQEKQEEEEEEEQQTKYREEAEPEGEESKDDEEDVLVHVEDEDD